MNCLHRNFTFRRLKRGGFVQSGTGFLRIDTLVGRWWAWSPPWAWRYPPDARKIPAPSPSVTSNMSPGCGCSLHPDGGSVSPGVRLPPGEPGFSWSKVSAHHRTVHWNPTLITRLPKGTTNYPQPPVEDSDLEMSCRETRLVGNVFPTFREWSKQ